MLALQVSPTMSDGGASTRVLGLRVQALEPDTEELCCVSMRDWLIGLVHVDAEPSTPVDLQSNYC